MKQCTHNKPKIGLLKINLISGSIILNIAINKSFEVITIHHQKNYFPNQEFLVLDITEAGKVP